MSASLKLKVNHKLRNRKKETIIYEVLKNKWLYMLTLPGILFFIIFNYIPMVGIYIAFTDFNPIKGIIGSKIVGLENFKFFFSSSEWIRVTVNTIYLNALFIVTGLLLQVIMAVALSELGRKVFRNVAQTLMFLPNFISWTVVSVMSLALFSTDEGVINSIIGFIGFEHINFYQEAGVWPLLLVILRIWKSVGYGTVIYLATISGIDQELYQAADIDGANRMQMIFHITLPMLKTTTVMLFILSVGGIFYGDFGMIYALVGDNPMVRDTTDVIDTYVYRALRLNNDIGMSSAVGLFQSVVGFVMVIAANKIAKRVDSDSTLF